MAPEAIVPRWQTPLYKLKTLAGERVTIDVTKSVSAGLGPSQILAQVIPYLKDRNVQRILDFCAGALRHALPLLQAGFEVCAVDFQSGFQRPACSAALQNARNYQSFCQLVFPSDFSKDRRRWDAALLCYVLQTMPIAAERSFVLKTIAKKLEADAYLLYMSRFHQLPVNIKATQRINDGYYLYPKHSTHTFYREFETQETHQMMGRFGFKRIRSYSQRGTDQMYLYTNGTGTFI